MRTLRRFRSDPRISRFWNSTLYATLPVAGWPVGRRRRRPGPPRVLADVSDQARAGAFTALAAMLDALVDRGFEVRLVTSEMVPESSCEVVPRAGSVDLMKQYRWSDVVVTQRVRTKMASRLAAFMHRPMIYVLHDPTTDPWSELRRAPDLMVTVAEHILAAHGDPDHGMVVRPPIDAAPYRTTPGDAITLVNLSEWKGARVFYALAERLPDHRFLGVRGWGEQIVPEPLPDNVEILGPTDDMKAVYARTRILLTPSWSEGFPRTPLEAAASGIPVIAHPCAGLREAMGDAGRYADRADLDAWQDAVVTLDDAHAHAEAARGVAARFAEVTEISARDADRLADWVRTTVSPPTTGPTSEVT